MFILAINSHTYIHLYLYVHPPVFFSIVRKALFSTASFILTETDKREVLFRRFPAQGDTGWADTRRANQEGSAARA